MMTLAIVLFLLATVVMLLLTIPFAMLLGEVEGLWENICFWAIVVLAWASVWFAVSYGQ
jgi:hypothetical protein